MKILKKVLLWLASLTGILILLVVVVGWSLSSRIPPDMIEYFESLAYYQEGAFFNEERQAPYEFGWQAIEDQFFGEEQREPPSPVPVVEIDPARFAATPSQSLRVNWLGHSSTLVEFDGYRVLIDPVFSERASPYQFLGPRRFHPPPVALANVKNVDVVVVSHNHYDHFDEVTIRHLAAQGAHIFVPLGVSERLKGWEIPAEQIHSLEWWQEIAVGDLRVVATPARHYSGRGLFDYKETHWASWSLIGPEHRVFYSGDSVYSKLFSQIGERLGPFDLTVIKVGSYGPDQSWLDIHMVPEDSVRVHRDVRGKQMLPVHWATFNLGYHDWDEPIKRTLDAAASNGVQLVVPKLGATVDIYGEEMIDPWWESVR